MVGQDIILGFLEGHSGVWFCARDIAVGLGVGVVEVGKKLKHLRSNPPLVDAKKLLIEVSDSSFRDVWFYKFKSGRRGVVVDSSAGSVVRCRVCMRVMKYFSKDGLCADHKDRGGSGDC